MGYNTTVTVITKLYKGGTEVYSQTHPGTIVSEGIFNLTIGPMDTVAFNQPIDLGVKVGSNPEMSPRTPLQAAPFAFGLRGFYTVPVSQSDTVTVNLIGGALVNSIGSTVVGATISGGGASRSGSQLPNQVSGDFGTVGGGLSNTAGGIFSTVSGGRSNDASGEGATIAGGVGNKAIHLNSTVGGGERNKAAVSYSWVGGGLENVASGLASAVPGGAYNQARHYAPLRADIKPVQYTKAPSSGMTLQHTAERTRSSRQVTTSS